MNRIAITGCAGSGKSYLSIKLHEKTGLPLYNLDQYYWKPGWIRSEPEHFTEIHNELCKKERWIIEGSYMRYMELRFENADTIIFLNFPRWFCLIRIFKRAILNWGKVTSTAPNGCPEKLTWEFVKWVWHYKKKYDNYVMSLLNKYPNSKKIYIIKNTQELNNFVNFL